MGGPCSRFSGLVDRRPSWAQKKSWEFVLSRGVREDYCYSSERSGINLGTGGIAFRCLDCELDSNCVVCPDCFYGGNHEGHHVKLISRV